MPLDYNKLYESYEKQKAAERARETRRNAPAPTSTETGGVGSRIGGIITEVAKEAAKSALRPLTAPFGLLVSGITGEDVKMPEYLGGLEISTKPERAAEQAKLAAGTALEALALLPAGKGLAALRKAPLKGMTLKELKKLGKEEAVLGAITGAESAAGHELGVNQGTLQSTLGAGFLGAGIGYGAGFVSPFAAKGLGNIWRSVQRAWKGEAEDAFQAGLRREAAAGVRKAGAIQPEGEAVAVRSLHEMDEDIFPMAAKEARVFDEKLKTNATNLGFKESQINLLAQASNKERAQMREMLEMSIAKVKNPLHHEDPTEVPARLVISPVNHLKRRRAESGQALDKAVDAMPDKPIAITPERNGLINWFAERNIHLKKDGLTLDFSKSKYRTSASKADRDILQEIFAQLNPRKLDKFAPGEIHRTPKEIRTLRQALREIEENKIREGKPLSNEMETMIDGLRTGLNRPLAAISDDYRVENETYAVTSETLTDFYKFLGQRFYDADDELANMRVQELLARLVSNAPANVKVILDKVSDAARKTGMTEDLIQDPRRLIYADEILSDMYDLQAARGLQGVMERAGGKVVERFDLARDVLGAARGGPLSILRLGQKAMSLFDEPLVVKREKVLRQMLEDSLEASNGPITAPGIPGGGKGAGTGGTPLTGPPAAAAGDARGIPLGESPATFIPPGEITRLGDKNVIPRILKNSKPGEREALGAMMGLEAERDQEGNITGLQINPKKAAMGVGLMMGITRGKGTKAGKQITEIVSNITTKTLEKLKGRTKISKQFIQNLTNADDLKQAERDLLRRVLEASPEKVDVPTFTRKVQDELLPLKAVPQTKTGTGGAYEHIVLPSELRGEVANYAEHVYESPIKTSAGQTHYPNSKNYFGHTRVEDLPDKTRRVIEVQSDLYQKGRMESEFTDEAARKVLDKERKTLAAQEKRISEGLSMDAAARASMNKRKLNIAALEKRVDESARGLKTLSQYNDPTAHFRMIREEVKRAAVDGKKKLQFPTGETAMKVEGLGSENNFVRIDPELLSEYENAGRDITDILNEGAGEPLSAGSKLSVGDHVTNATEFGGDEFIITDVLGDGKFKAVQKKDWENNAIRKGPRFELSKETFDISGKIDKENPIYKFYEKDVGKYLRGKYDAKLVTDKQGVKWWEMEIKPEYGKRPVEAFGLLPASAAAEGTRRKEPEE